MSTVTKARTGETYTTASATHVPLLPMHQTCAASSALSPQLCPRLSIRKEKSAGKLVHKIPGDDHTTYSPARWLPRFSAPEQQVHPAHTSYAQRKSLPSLHPLRPGDQLQSLRLYSVAGRARYAAPSLPSERYRSPSPCV